jgi:hypothetical protein
LNKKYTLLKTILYISQWQSEFCKLSTPTTLAGADFCKKSSEVYFVGFILQQQRRNTPSERAMLSIWISFYTRVARKKPWGDQQTLLLDRQ